MDGALTVTGRRSRVVATLVVFTVLTVGSLRGTDHHFPFGPFRMFATSGRTTGAVRTAALVGVAGGQPFHVDSESLGLRRAELEGQYDQFRREPRLLASLAEALGRRGVRVDELRLVQEVRPIVNRRPAGPPTAEVVAVWRRPR